MSATDRSASPAWPGRRIVPFADLAGMHAPLMPEFDNVWRQVTTTSGFIGGTLVDRFEAEWAAYVGRRHCIGVANGTDAITVALRGLGIGPGDEVLVPTNTFIATAEGVLNAGATVVFVDVDPVSLQVTSDHLADAITARTAAALIVHLYGHMPDMDSIAAVCRERSILLVEDAAQAHGSKWRGRPAGAFGDAATFSFYPSKNLGGFGDGGAIVCDDDAAVARMRSVANHGRSREDRYVHPVVGTNSRLDALQAGVLSVKMRHLDRWSAQRDKAAAMYIDALATPDAGTTVVRPLEGCSSSWHLFVVQLEDREGVMTRLGHAGVHTAIHYPVPCHRQEAFAGYQTPSLPVAERAARRVLSLPMFPHIRAEDISHVASALRGALRVGDV